eukprot:scpid86723/ scgid30038/ 
MQSDSMLPSYDRALEMRDLCSMSDGTRHRPADQQTREEETRQGPPPYAAIADECGRQNPCPRNASYRTVVAVQKRGLRRRVLTTVVVRLSNTEPAVNSTTHRQDRYEQRSENSSSVNTGGSRNGPLHESPPQDTHCTGGSSVTASGDKPRRRQKTHRSPLSSLRKCLQ